MAAPKLVLQTIRTQPPDPVERIAFPVFNPISSVSVLDLRTVKMTDGTNETLLSEVFSVTPGAHAAIKTDVYFTDGENIAEFDFKFDGETDVTRFAAGRAYLFDGVDEGE